MFVWRADRRMRRLFKIRAKWVSITCTFILFAALTIVTVGKKYSSLCKLKLQLVSFKRLRGLRKSYIDLFLLRSYICLQWNEFMYSKSQ